MAREESDREDLLREATGLVDRVELRCTWLAEAIVCGFRKQGAFSLFVGQDEVYQFNTHGALRRGYWKGQLLKAEQGRLVALTRHRSAGATRLLRDELSNDQQREHLQRLQRRIAQLSGAFERSEFALVGEVRGTGAQVVNRVHHCLQSLTGPIRIAGGPRVT